MKGNAMNNTTESLEAITVSGLPAGYNDERSLWYIEPDLREAYARIADDDVQPDVEFAQRVEAGADRIARHELDASAHVDAAELVAARRERVAQIKREQLAFAFAVDTHVRKVAGARLVLANDQRIADSQALAEQLGTCPVCGEYDDTNGKIRTRNVFGDSHFSFGPREGDVRSCGNCFLVAVEAARASATTSIRLTAATRALVQ